MRAENFAEAERLRKALPVVEAQMPVTALESLAQERAQRALDEALNSEMPLVKRLNAVQRLQTLATPPVATGDAENALHCVLTAACEDEVCELAEAALWAVWLASGDELVDATMRQGLKLMGAGELAKATRAFTEVVAVAPSFAEGWNKRATALFLAERFDESIEDCCRVLELKPRHFGCLSGLGICHLRKGNEQIAARWLRRALEVNPRSGDVQRIVANLEERWAATLLRTRIKEVLDVMEMGRPTSTPIVPAAASAQVQADWDVYRVQDMDMSTYYFRVRVACLDGPRVNCMARYYVLQQGSSVLPLSRVTSGTRGFSLRPGQTYQYSFMLTMAKGLSAVQGGLLLRSDEEDTVESGLQYIQLQAVPSVGEVDLESLNQGYHFMGRIQIDE